MSEKGGNEEEGYTSFHFLGCIPVLGSILVLWTVMLESQNYIKSQLPLKAKQNKIQNMQYKNQIITYYLIINLFWYTKKRAQKYLGAVFQRQKLKMHCERGYKKCFWVTYKFKPESWVQCKIRGGEGTATMWLEHSKHKYLVSGVEFASTAWTASTFNVPSAELLTGPHAECTIAIF